MAIVIDGQDTGLPVSPTLTELYMLLDELHQSGRYEQRIFLNGSEQTLETLMDHKHALSESDEIEIVTYSLNELIEDTLHTALDIQPKFYQSLQFSAKSFRVGDFGVGGSRFNESIDLFQWHVDVLGRLTSLHSGPSAIHELFDGLQCILQQLLEAWKNEDFVLLADQLEYETLPWIERWYTFLQTFEQQMVLEKTKAGLHGSALN